jgi:hypothetical protein
MRPRTPRLDITPVIVNRETTKEPELCKEEFGHAQVPLSPPRLRRLVPLSIGLPGEVSR